MVNFHDLTGRSFGLWTVVERRPHRHETTRWLCRCACGTEREVTGPNLYQNKSLGCGCNRQHHTTHGHASRSGRTPTYRIWKNVHSRCKPEYKQASDYFERGIRVCERWNTFENFLADMGERPTDALSIDRIDNDGNYEPGNCRWTTAAVQRRNGRWIIPIVWQGKQMVLKDAAALLGVTDTAVHQERTRHGGTFQEAFDRVAARRFRR